MVARHIKAAHKLEQREKEEELSVTSSLKSDNSEKSASGIRTLFSNLNVKMFQDRLLRLASIYLSLRSIALPLETS